MENQIVVALDIGTTKICAMVGRKDKHGKLEILGTGKVVSVGVLRGVVSNIEKTIKGITDAIAEAERHSGVEIAIVNVGIAGQHIKSLQHRGILTRNSLHEEISQADIDNLIMDMYKLALPAGDKIIHVIPQEFIVDNEQGIVDPIGMSGIRLEANFHVITGQTTATKNIAKCVQKAGLEMSSLALEPIASSSAVLSDEELEAGVVLVDIGGGTTDIAIFHEGIIRHTAVIPLGGNIITKDIKEGCNVMGQQAEKLKVKFGAAMTDALTENRIITIPGLRRRSHKEISEVNLSRIIQARMEEILDLVYWEIRRSGFERKLIGGIVLTGGGSLLRNLVDLVELHTGMSTRLGLPTEHLANGYDQAISSPIYATSVGLILNGFKELSRGCSYESSTFSGQHDFETSSSKDSNEPEKTNRWLEKVFKKTKEWFEAEPDGDF